MSHQKIALRSAKRLGAASVYNALLISLRMKRSSWNGGTAFSKTC